MADSTVRQLRFNFQDQPHLSFPTLLRSFIVAITVISLSSHSWASDSNSQPQEIQTAQFEPDEAYDPFTDYSDFDESTEEEADINFFRNGRFFTVGLIAGTRGFTGNFSKIYGSRTTFGVGITYFFDLRSALGITFLTGDHPMLFKTDQRSYTGNSSFTSISFDFKYYVGSQNITRGLADLNPYFLIGFAQWYNSTTIDQLSAELGPSRQSPLGGNIGLGLEVPLLRKKAFLGLQGVYHYVNFPDENKTYLNETERLDIKISGDLWDGTVTLGMNF